MVGATATRGRNSVPTSEHSTWAVNVSVDNRDPRNKGRFMPDSPAVGSSSSPTPAGADEQELKPKKKGLFKGRS